MTHEIDRIAARQWGLISSSQLRQIGLSRDRIRNRHGAGDLIKLRRGVYRLPGAPLGWEQAILAAALAVGAQGVVSHTTAAALWDLKHSDRHTAGVHITAPRQIRMCGVRSHVYRLSPEARTVHRDIPVTTPDRTIIDLASTLSGQRLGECVDDALRRRLVRLDRLRAMVSEASLPGAGRRLLAPLHDVLAERIHGYCAGDSDWEREMDRQWDQLGLPAAARQFRVTLGGRCYRIDRAIPELKIGVEWNGYDTHGTRSCFDRDSDRRADLTAAGWHMIDFTSHSSADRIVNAVLRAVQERASRSA